jgi:superfamily II DNA/RNA helicase
VHFDPPSDAKDYVHRSGRTGRAGASGLVVSLVHDDVAPAVRALQRVLGHPTTVTAPDVAQDPMPAVPTRSNAKPKPNANANRNPKSRPKGAAHRRRRATQPGRRGR